MQQPSRRKCKRWSIAIVLPVAREGVYDLENEGIVKIRNDMNDSAVAASFDNPTHREKAGRGHGRPGKGRKVTRKGGGGGGTEVEEGNEGGARDLEGLEWGRGWWWGEVHGGRGV
ncbi:hypothetical protein Droror1_Dr00011090 [Drosera rotundifolia]